MTNYALLDYDGFICKAFYAATKNGETDIESALTILDSLTEAAISKAQSFFETEIEVCKYVSSHTLKKDFFPSYKAKRKKNDLLGDFRDIIIDVHDCLKINGFEADDLIFSQMADKGQSHCLVFSDDKDMVDFSKYLCGINLTEEPIELDPNESLKRQYIHYLKGDKEDNIEGIPQVGETKASKILDNVDIPILKFHDFILEEYKKHGVSFEEAVKNIYLLTPIYVHPYMKPVSCHKIILTDIIEKAMNIYANK